MKVIENKKLSIKPGDIKDYFNLIALCVNKSPEGGYDISEMRKRVKILDKLEGGKDKVEFEDAEFACIKQCVVNMRWGFAHIDLINFVDYISNLK